MSLHLTDFGTYNEVERVSFFTFTIGRFSGLKTNKISRAFGYAGHLWKLQVRKVAGHLGLFLRWYSTKMKQESHVKCLCKTGLQFIVINHLDSKHSLTEGNLLEDDIYDRPGSGIGYGEVIELKYLDKIPGYLISDTLVVQVRLQVKSTTFIDKLSIITRPDRIFVRGLSFQFHGAEWSFVLFPNGEQESNSEEEGEQEENTEQEDADLREDAMEEGGKFKIEKTLERNKSTLYLSRELPRNRNASLRHRVQFLLFVLGGPCFEIVQNFHEKQSSIFGTGYLMDPRELQKLGASGVIRVGVTFLEIIPYVNFGYDLNDNSAEGIGFVDQRDIPWLLRISSTNEDDEEELSCLLKLDPESKCKRVKALAARDRALKTVWHVKIINFKDAEMSLDVFSEQSSLGEGGMFSCSGEEQSVVIQMKKSQASNKASPYVDDDGQACLLISILDANFIYKLANVDMNLEQVVEIARFHKDEAVEMKRDSELREKIWQITMSNLENEKNDILNTSKEELERQDNELKQKDFIIKSLEEKLDTVEGYVHSLESNSLEDIDKFNKTCISKLLESCKPDQAVIERMDYLFEVMSDILKRSSDDIVSVVSAGAYGEGTLTKTDSKIDIVIFVKGELESSMKNGDFNSCLEFLHKTLGSSEDLRIKDTKNTFIDFMKTPISLKCIYESINVEIFPTKNWIENGYHVLYEASIGLTTESLKCFVTATSERRSSFIQSQDQQCRDLIRLLKTWAAGVNWEDERSSPSSYLLSLLTIRAYEVIMSTNAANTPVFCKEVLNEVAVISIDEDLRIAWEKYYEVSEYDLFNSASMPLVRDPALPSHNVAESGLGDWTQFRKELSRWLSSLCP